MKKYNIYQLQAGNGVFIESNNYREIFASYQRADVPKTLYGITEQGDIEVIMSK